MEWDRRSESERVVADDKSWYRGNGAGGRTGEANLP